MMQSLLLTGATNAKSSDVKAHKENETLEGKTEGSQSSGASETSKSFAKVMQQSLERESNKKQGSKIVESVTVDSDAEEKPLAVKEEANKKLLNKDKSANSESLSTEKPTKEGIEEEQSIRSKNPKEALELFEEQAENNSELKENKTINKFHEITNGIVVGESKTSKASSNLSESEIKIPDSKSQPPIDEVEKLEVAFESSFNEDVESDDTAKLSKSEVIESNVIVKLSAKKAADSDVDAKLSISKVADSDATDKSSTSKVADSDIAAKLSTSKVTDSDVAANLSTSKVTDSNASDKSSTREIIEKEIVFASSMDAKNKSEIISEKTESQSIESDLASNFSTSDFEQNGGAFNFQESQTNNLEFVERGEFTSIKELAVSFSDLTDEDKSKLLSVEQYDFNTLPEAKTDEDLESFLPSESKSALDTGESEQQNLLSQIAAAQKIDTSVKNSVEKSENDVLVSANISEDVKKSENKNKETVLDSFINNNEKAKSTLQSFSEKMGTPLVAIADQGDSVSESSQSLKSGGEVSLPEGSDKSDTLPSMLKNEMVLGTPAVADVNGARPNQASLIQLDKLVAVNQQAQANNNLLQQPLDLQSKQAASMMGERVMMMISQGQQELIVRLDPAELGSMMIKVQVQQDQIQLNIQTQVAQSKDIIEQNMPRLREQLAQQGIQLGDTNVQQQSQQQTGQQRQNGSNSAIGQQANGVEMADEDQTSVWIPSKIPSRDQGIDFYA
ncbi:flagellar hook-length control protein FliK [Psychromonas sp.]|nr:flagellar hook-length control protein FliK [Psychromonas sp.]